MKRIMCLLAVALMVFAFGSLTYAGETADSVPGNDYGGGQPTAPEGSISASLIWGNANIFQPTFPSPSTTNVYKDLNGVFMTNIIRFADYGTGGQKWKLIIATRKGDRANYIFRENNTSEPNSCVRNSSGEWKNYRQVVLQPGNYAKLVKMKIVSGWPGTGVVRRLAYLYFNGGGGDAGWRQTGGARDYCNW